jgi:hypothetical protein
LNYVKRIAQQQLMLGMQVKKKKSSSWKDATLIYKKFLVKLNLNFAGFKPGPSDYQALDLTTMLSEPIQRNFTIPIHS